MEDAVPGTAIQLNRYEETTSGDSFLEIEFYVTVILS
jgi:hypothetical protein